MPPVPTHLSACLAIGWCLAGTGCSPTPAVAIVAADLTSVAVLHRGLFDLAYDAVTGKDCSVVRLDRGERWCTHPRPLPAPGYCTRTLGSVECWQQPAAVSPPAASLADGPAWAPAVPQPTPLVPPA